MRKNIVAGNWKMNMDIQSGLKLASEIINMAKDEVLGQTEIVLAPPFIHLTNVARLLEDYDNIFLAAQNCNDHGSGAYTGEISVDMIKSTGATHVIIGHSERREYYGETNAILKTKVDLALEAGLTPIFCCGETLETRESGQHFDFVCNQLTESVFHLSETEFAKLIIAYEPIWAIGTGVTATSNQAQEMHARLREHIDDKYSDETADSTSILYGGSCKPDNAEELFACNDVDGGLIGGASLKSRDFVDIIKSFK